MQIKNLVTWSPRCLSFGKAEELQIQRCQGVAVDDYGVPPAASALKLSSFRSISVWRSFLKSRYTQCRVVLKIFDISDICLEINLIPA